MTFCNSIMSSFELEVGMVGAYHPLCAVEQVTEKDWQSMSDEERKCCEDRCEILLHVSRLSVDAMLNHLRKTLPRRLGVYRVVWTGGERFVDKSSVDADVQVIQLITAWSVRDCDECKIVKFLRDPKEALIQGAVQEAVQIIKVHPHLSSAMSTLIMQGVYCATMYPDLIPIVPTILQWQLRIDGTWLPFFNIVQFRGLPSRAERAPPNGVIVFRVSRLSVDAIATYLHCHYPDATWRLRGYGDEELVYNVSTFDVSVEVVGWNQCSLQYNV